MKNNNELREKYTDGNWKIRLSGSSTLSPLGRNFWKYATCGNSTIQETEDGATICQVLSSGKEQIHKIFTKEYNDEGV